MDEQILGRITADPERLAGKATIRGLRISVQQILSALAGGVSEAELLEDYPQLEPEDIRAALLYASSVLDRERIYRVGPPA